MAEPKVFFVHLRRPDRTDRDERRDDPFYEFGSFGCTRCHFTNLLHPRHAKDLEGARLAFIQGGRLGSRLVFLTPPVTLKVWKGNCEARWTPPDMPFKYTEAPILVSNDGRSYFPSVKRYARKTHCTTIEGGLSSLFRARAKPLPPEMANEVIAVYERKRAEAGPSAIASKYEEALPYAPRRIDRDREATYQRLVSQLADDSISAFRRDSVPDVACKARKGRRKKGA